MILLSTVDRLFGKYLKRFKILLKLMFICIERHSIIIAFLTDYL